MYKYSKIASTLDSGVEMRKGDEVGRERTERSGLRDGERKRERGGKREWGAGEGDY